MLLQQQKCGLWSIQMNSVHVVYKHVEDWLEVGQLIWYSGLTERSAPRVTPETRRDTPRPAAPGGRRQAARHAAIFSGCSPLGFRYNTFVFCYFSTERATWYFTSSFVYSKNIWLDSNFNKLQIFTPTVNILGHFPNISENENDVNSSTFNEIWMILIQSWNKSLQSGIKSPTPACIHPLYLVRHNLSQRLHVSLIYINCRCNG